MNLVGYNISSFYIFKHFLSNFKSKMKSTCLQGIIFVLLLVSTSNWNNLHTIDPEMHDYLLIAAIFLTGLHVYQESSG